MDLSALTLGLGAKSGCTFPANTRPIPLQVVLISAVPSSFCKSGRRCSWNRLNSQTTCRREKSENSTPRTIHRDHGVVSLSSSFDHAKQQPFTDGIETHWFLGCKRQRERRLERQGSDIEIAAATATLSRFLTFSLSSFAAGREQRKAQRLEQEDTPPATARAATACSTAAVDLSTQGSFMAEFAADVPDEGKGPPPATAASGGGGREEDSYPLTVIYCGGGFDAETIGVVFLLLS